ncbi:MAG: SPOR domain-containing protein [Candidatus Omnitrophica bacterium]|nr:SPOR domain-containing protein [Candidatus Omnitrophota bacterium]
MQKDLFDPTSEWRGVRSAAPKSSFLERYRLSMRLDQMIVVCISLLVSSALVFGVGVEHGRKMERVRAKQPKAEGLIRRVIPKAETVKVTVDTKKENQDNAIKATQIAIQEISVAAATADTKSIDVVEKGKYTIQIVTYTNENDAEKQIKKLESLGHKGFVIPSGRYRQVCMNRFNDKDQARTTLRQLKAQGMIPPDAYVRPITR